MQVTLLVLGAGLLAGCQSTDRGAPAPAPRATAARWQVVERLGDARYRSADATVWAPAMPATILPPGSQVATGRGGRLIAARAGTHLSAGPGSRFDLPAATPEAALEQRAGRLRYRIAESAPQRLVVATRFLEIAPAAAVFDVTVTPAATEIAVERGSVRIATPDGLRQIELSAGQSAYAGAGDDAGAGLTFKRAPGEPAEPVAPIVLPAMQPRASAAEGRAVRMTPGVADGAGSQASTSGAAASEAAVSVARADVTAAAKRRATAIVPVVKPARRAPPEMLGGSVVVPVGLVRQDAADRADAAQPHPDEPAAGGASERPVEPDAASAQPAEQVLAAPAVAAASAGPAPAEDLAFPFDRLTAGMVGEFASGARHPGPPAAEVAPPQP